MDFAVCNWFPENGGHLVAPHDLEGFAALKPNGKVFQCLGGDSGFLVVSYGDKIFRVSHEVMKAIPRPGYLIGGAVMAKGRVAVVAGIEWHFKDSVPIYFLAFDGKRSSRRYFEGELTVSSF